MTPLALALAVLLAAGEPAGEPPPSPPGAVPEPAAVPREPPTTPPAAEPVAGERPAEEGPAEPPPVSPPAAPEPPPAAPAPASSGGVQAGGAAPEAPATPAPPAPVGPPGVAGPPPSSEYSVQPGWSAVSLAGLGATGPSLRAAYTVQIPPHVRALHPNRPIAQVSTEIFAGETKAGLLVRSISVDAEAWLSSGPLLRFGAGLGLGWVAYRRETRSEWPGMLVPGARVGIEVAALRWPGGAVFLGARGAGYVGDEFWFSASIGVGVRFLRSAEERRSPAGEEGGEIRAE